MFRSADEIQQIEDFFNNYNWKWISKTKRFLWKDHCFHYTDLHNVIPILREGFLYSRNYMESINYSWNDIASTDVLSGTPKNVVDRVRFYFRPRTPTQYHIEGIKSIPDLNQDTFNVQCQIPVFFIFDIVNILSRTASEFSDGNLGSLRTATFSNPEHLYNLPWRNIYHDSFLDPYIVREIIRNRCAEITVPEKIDLNGLQEIYCRSEAEKETLLFYLSQNPELYQKYSMLVSSSGKFDLFFRRHTFIESVTLSDDRVLFYFSPDSKSPGPFDVRVEFFDIYSGDKIVRGKKFNNLTSSLDARIPNNINVPFIIDLYIDDYLVYENEISDFEGLLKFTFLN